MKNTAWLISLSPHFTVSKFLAGSLHRAFNGVKPECFQLLEVLCINESNELEPNLARCVIKLTPNKCSDY